METKAFKITVEDAAKLLKKLIDDADCDGLAALVEHAFGCEVADSPELSEAGEVFVVTPIEGEYCGGLDEAKQ
jgi:hypothetical protein